MTTPATPNDALLAPDDIDALVGDAVASAPEEAAVTSEAVTPTVEPKDKLAIADRRLDKFAADYFFQVYGVPKQDVRFVQTLDGLAGAIGAYPKITNLYFLFHAAQDRLLFGYPDTTKEVLVDEVTVRLLRDRGTGTIDYAYFDSCTLGLEPIALFNFAQLLGVREVVGWTRWHYIGRWAAALAPNVATLDAATLDLLQRGAPWASNSAKGATYAADDLANMLLTNKYMRVIVELFNASMMDIVFDELLAQNAFIPARHAHRAEATDQFVLSLAEATAFKSQITPLDPLKRVIAKAPL